MVILPWTAILAFTGCGLTPEKISLSDPQVQPLLKAMEQVDRASLGFTPVTTNAQIKLELSSGGSYDAMLHVDGITSRTIAFRKTTSGYRWIFEQEIYEGPKWYQTVDGTFREYLDIEYQTEPVDGIPVNQLFIRYTGSDTNLERRSFTLAEIRPILDYWRTAPLESRPPDLPGPTFPDPLPALVFLLTLLAFLVGCCLVFLIGTVCLAIVAVMLAAGIVSSSIIVGILRRSGSAGFRALFIQLGAVAGMVGGAVATCGVTWISKASWHSPFRWVTGVLLGLLFGVLFAWIFNKVWSRIAQALTKKLENRN